MDKPIVKLTRDNHFNNLVNNLPLFTILYGTQCALAYYVFYEIIDPGIFAIALGACLIFLISSLYIYDRFHHVIVYKNRLHIYFELFGVSKSIHFEDIKDILTPEMECEFSSIRFLLTDDRVYDLHFVDYPLQVKKVILSHISNFKRDKQKEQTPINDLAA